MSFLICLRHIYVHTCNNIYIQKSYIRESQIYIKEIFTFACEGYKDINTVMHTQPAKLIIGYSIHSLDNFCHHFRPTNK